MSADLPRLVLASASPRRAEILKTLGLAFEVRVSGADENALEEEDDIAFVRAAALAKLTTVLDEIDEEGVFVLAADTVVCVEGARLGQPDDDEDALRMLGLLMGRDHIVRTAVALGRARHGVLECRVVETRVWFRGADVEELRRYVARGESGDKAGGYGVQGMASGFVTRLEGSYTNVVGLPAAEVVGLLLEHGALDRWP